ncbi:MULTISPECIES: peptidoglycan-binding protein [unclassified Streptomyces]|uniref:peptidoglycan-binding protein n=1 Tax=unclassified Streptomyces TaxID=2593676 RepID=UPI002E15F6CB|nr:peptidoglycan-binding protein [Streptomyces sp. NBC_01197]WSS49017.1 peptidoglycan-binding protein [Streptomyces sp. NBC_01180]
MTDPWLPGAERHPLRDTAPTDKQYPPKVLWHITWDKNATASKPADLVPFSNLVRYFTGGGSSAAPHLLWDPFSGRIAQFYPATSRSKSVVDLAGGTRTNRAGKVVIQVETLFFPHCRVGGKTYATVADTPCKGLDKILAWTGGWGVPDTWPMGKPTWKANRSERVWETKGGHYGHGQAPENGHTDPGPMPNWPSKSPQAPKPKPKPTPHPFPGASAFGPGKSNAHILLLGQQLVRKGFGSHYKVGPSKDWGEADRLNVAAFQHHQGWKGSDADGYPGPETWRRLFK